MKNLCEYLYAWTLLVHIFYLFKYNISIHQLYKILLQIFTFQHPTLCYSLFFFCRILINFVLFLSIRFIFILQPAIYPFHPYLMSLPSGSILHFFLFLPSSLNTSSILILQPIFQPSSLNTQFYPYSSTCISTFQSKHTVLSLFFNLYFILPV